MLPSDAFKRDLSVLAQSLFLACCTNMSTLLSRWKSRIPGLSPGISSTPGHDTVNGVRSSTLPPEILLHIFDYLQRSPPDWTIIMSLALQERRPDHVQEELDDLRATSLVCRVWHDCAASFLYARAYLCTERHLERLLRTLRTNPALASLVKAIRLPDETESLPDVQPSRRSLALGQRHLRNLGRDVDKLLVLCSDATDIGFRVNTQMVGAIHGYQQIAQRATRLELAAGQGSKITRLTSVLFPTPSEPDPPIANMVLQHLTLQGLLLSSTADLLFPNLTTLRIRFCQGFSGWLKNLLEHARALEVLHLESYFADDIAEELRPAAGTLRELRMDWSVRSVGDGLAFLQHLRVLELSLHCVIGDSDDDIALPPSIETLVLSCRGLVFRGHSTLSMAAGTLRRRLPAWAESNLARLELTGDVSEPDVLKDFAIVSYLLQPYCRSIGIEFEMKLLYLHPLGAV